MHYTCKHLHKENEYLPVIQSASNPSAGALDYSNATTKANAQHSSVQLSSRMFVVIIFLFVDTHTHTSSLACMCRCVVVHLSKPRFHLSLRSGLIIADCMWFAWHLCVRHNFWNLELMILMTSNVTNIIIQQHQHQGEKQSKVKYLILFDVVGDRH